MDASLGLGAGADHALLEKLPEREIAAKRAAHQGWDSGVPGRMLDATNRYNAELTAMIGDLVAADYPRTTLRKEEVAAYVRLLRETAEFRHKLANPANEDRGELDGLDVPSVVSNDLENTVEQMVKAIADASHGVDYASWKQRWDDARKTGDAETPAAPSPATAATPGPVGSATR